MTPKSTSLQRILLFTLVHVQILTLGRFALGQTDSSSNPNVVVIYTDEQSFRTIGAYRKLLSHDQSFIWGDNIKVHTPNIDALANEGVLFNNFYTVAPLCTPSRASLFSGLYPKTTGAWKNHSPMNGDVMTFADVMKQKRNMATGYFGKFHLDGEKKPLWKTKEGREFGFNFNKYRWNRGHWKFINEEEDGSMRAYDYAAKGQFPNEEKHYTTDYLFDRAIEYIEARRENGKNFLAFLSIPDPHTPHTVRPPYDTMYSHFDFKVPQTAIAGFKKTPALPPYIFPRYNITEANDNIRNLGNLVRTDMFRRIFGMIKLIDDNVGKMMTYLKNAGLDENTIVVFTSDHGDLMGEHTVDNKGRPYETSAKVPFIMRYPGKIPAGRIIHKTWSSIDFAPTILSLLGINVDEYDFHGGDMSSDILEPQSNEEEEDNTIFLEDTYQGRWAAVISNRYKYVVSKSGIPWLFDLNEDPDEIINFYEMDARYTAIGDDMRNKLLGYIDKYGPLRLTDVTNVVYFDKPACHDPEDQIDAFKFRECQDLTNPNFSSGCDYRSISHHCPFVCHKCCDDADGQLWIGGQLKYCSELQGNCQSSRVRQFCRKTCNACEEEIPFSSVETRLWEYTENED